VTQAGDPGALTNRLADDTRGLALVEFAITLPFLFMLFVGGFQLSDAVSAYRKVTTASRTIADLTSQYTSVMDSDLETILNASQQVMAPYPAANAKMTVSQIKIDNAGDAKVDWSLGKNMAKLAKGTPFNIPVSIKQRNTSLIVAQIEYAYRPTFFWGLLGTIPLTETIIMSPRATGSIVHT
jgi:Flp pilus assembly protein TadG